jgi:transcriptional regulator with XRE-family HTH domain
MAPRREIDPTASAAALYAVLLRTYRDAKGWTQETLGDRCGCTGDLISLIERAKQVATPEMSKKFDELFGTGELFQWLQPIALRDITLPSFVAYVEREKTATVIRAYSQTLIMGLLQTPDYARAMLTARRRPEDAEELIQTRLDRQKILTRDGPPWLVVVMNEIALRNVFGDVGIMREQLARLLEIASEPNVKLHVIPTRKGIRLESPFTMLGFDKGDPVGYIEAVAGQGKLMADRATVDALTVLFDLVLGDALPAVESATLIREILEEM